MAEDNSFFNLDLTSDISKNSPTPASGGPSWLTETPGYKAPTQQELLSTPAYNIKADTLGLGRYIKSGLFDELGYNPIADNEDRYYQATPWYKQMGNATAQFFGQATQAFGAGFNKAEQAREIFGTTGGDYLKDQYAFSEMMREKYPVFKSANETAGILGYIPGFGAGSKWANFFPNLGFLVGTAGQVFIENTIATAIIGGTTLGAGTPIALAKWTQGLHKVFKIGFNLFKTRKVVQATKGAAAVVDLWTDSIKLFGASSGLLKGYEAFQGGKTAMGILYSAYGGYQVISNAAGEAIIENSHTLGESMSLIKDEFIKTHGREPNESELSEIQEITEETILPTTLGNIAVLSISNALQDFNALKLGRSLSTSLGGSLNLLSKKALRDITIDKTTGLARKLAQNEIRKGLLNSGTRFGLDALMEGLEESSQGIIATASKEWALANYSGGDTAWTDHLGAGVVHAFSEEGKEEFWAGVVTGTLFSGAGRLRNKMLEANEGKSLAELGLTFDTLQQSIIKEMNESLEGIMKFHFATGESAKNLNVQSEYYDKITEFDDKGQTVNADQYRTLALIKAVFTAKNYGKDEAYIEHLEVLKSLQPGELAAYLGIENRADLPTQEELDDVINTAKKASSLADKVMRTYNNPYNYNNPLDPKYYNIKGAEELKAQDTKLFFDQKAFIKERAAFEAWQGAQELLVIHSIMYDKHLEDYNEVKHKIQNSGIELGKLAAIVGTRNEGATKVHTQAKIDYLNKLAKEIKTNKQSLKDQKSSTVKDKALEKKYEREVKDLEKEQAILSNKTTTPETKLEKINELRSGEDKYNITKSNLQSAGEIIRSYDDFNLLYDNTLTSEKIATTLNSSEGITKASVEMFGPILEARTKLFSRIGREVKKETVKKEEIKKETPAQPPQEGIIKDTFGVDEPYVEPTATDKFKKNLGALLKKKEEEKREEVKEEPFIAATDKADSIEDLDEDLYKRKKESGSSVAHNSVSFEIDGDNQFKLDKKENGELIFNEGPEASSQRINSKKIKVGDSLSFVIDFDSEFSEIKSIEEFFEKYNKLKDQSLKDALLDKVHVRIFHPIDNNDIGSLHTISFINSGNIVEENVEIEKDQVRRTRLKLLETFRDKGLTGDEVVSNSPITAIGVGYINLSDNYKIVSEIFESGDVELGIIKNDGVVEKPFVKGDKEVRFGWLSNAKKYAGIPVAIVMNNGKQYPILLRKNKVSEDPAIFEKLNLAVRNWIDATNKITEFGASQEQKDKYNEIKAESFSIIENYAYVQAFKDLNVLKSTSPQTGYAISILRDDKKDRLFIGAEEIKFTTDASEGALQNEKETIANQLSEILFNINLDNSSKEYKDEIFGSNLLSTRARANDILEKDTGEKAYFSQRTINYEPIGEVVENTNEKEIVTTETPKEVSEKTTDEKSEDAKLDNLLDNAGLEGVFGLEDEDLGVEDTLSEEIRKYNSRSRLVEELPLEKETDAVESIASTLIELKPEKGIFPIDLTKVPFIDQLSKLSKIIEAVDYEALSPKKRLQVNKINALIDNLSTILQEDNYGKLYDRALKVIKSFDIAISEEGFVEQLEDAVEDSMSRDQYNEDSEATRDFIKTMPSEAKKILHYIKDHRFKKGVLVQNLNSLALPKFANFRDLVDKTYTALSDRFFESSDDGYLKMLEILSGVDDPNVKELYNTLGKITNTKTKKHFFTAFNRSYTEREVLTVDKVGKNVFVRMINIGRNSGLKRMISALTNELKLAGHSTKKLSRFVDNDYIVNKTSAKEITDAWDTSYKVLLEIREQVEKISATKNITKSLKSERFEEQFTKVYDEAEKIAIILRDKGFNISTEAFDRYLRNRNLNNLDEINKLFFDRLKEAQLSDENVLITDLIDSTSIKKLSKFEYNQRKDGGVGVVKENGKQYNLFERTNYITDVFSKLKNQEYVRALVDIDVIAKGSKFLNSALNSITTTGVEADEQFAEKISSLFKIKYDHGFRVLKNEQKEINKANEYEYIANQQQRFINNGENNTKVIPFNFSDKKKKILFEFQRLENQGYSVGLTYTDGIMSLSDDFLEIVLDNIKTEANRIMLVQEQNKTLSDDEKIQGTHTFYDKEGNVISQGAGEFFLQHPWMNKDLLPKEISDVLYKSGEIQISEIDDLAEQIKNVSNDVFTKELSKTKEELRKVGFIVESSLQEGKEAIPYIMNSKNFLHHFLKNILGNTVKDGTTAFGVSNLSDALNLGQYKKQLNSFLLGARSEMVINAYVAAFVQNNYYGNTEYMYITGDIAQSGKFSPYKKGDKKNWLVNNIDRTFKNFNKRLAGYLASRDKFSFEDSNYRVAFANDMGTQDKIQSEINKQLDIRNEALTDAQELITVKEGLSVELAEGNITEEDYVGALYLLDPIQYAYDKENNDTTLRKAIEKLSNKGLTEELVINKVDSNKAFYENLVIQPSKPVQRFSVLDSNLQIARQQYIKSSAYIITRSMAEPGSILESLLNGMMNNNVGRIAFASSTKQGISGSKDIITENAFNNDFFTDNVHLYSRDGYGKQLEVPYDDKKSKINISTQMLNLLFVDIRDDEVIRYNGEDYIVKELKEKYKLKIEELVDLNLKELYKELGVEGKDDAITNLEPLSELLIREGLDRDYSMNTLFGLEIFENSFKIPLAFLPNVTQIEPVLMSIINNRVIKTLMPGKSLVQGSEVSLKLRKGKVSTDVGAREGDITWVDENYQPSELKDNEVVLPWLFKTNLENFITEDGYLDVSRMDLELLEFIGFRIPYQNLNSGELLKIVGFLPKVSGDLIIVSAELALKMGSDYDVDKLYNYMSNYNIVKEDKDQQAYNVLQEMIDEVKNQLDPETMQKYKDLIDYVNDYYIEDQEEFDKIIAGLNEVKELKEVHKEAVEDIRKLNKESLKRASIRKYEGTDSKKLIQNELIDIHKVIYGTDNKDIKSRIKSSIDTDNVTEAIDLVTGIISEDLEELPLNFSHIYQKDLHFSNRIGATSLGSSANANTLHAKAQEANLYSTSNLVFAKEDGKIYSDNVIDYKNSINLTKDSADPYTEEVNDEIVNRVDGKKGLWRLDKVRTFKNEITGKIHNISILISDLIGESVDNAKNQLLKLLGINDNNFNVYMGILQRGFDHVWASAFVQQPIFNKLYEKIDSQSNSFADNSLYIDIDSTIDELIEEIAFDNDIDLFDEEGNAVEFKEIPIKLLYLIENKKSPKTINKKQALIDINLLNKYRTLNNDGIDILTIISNYNVVAKKLPKNVSENLIITTNIDKVLDDGLKNIRNSHNMVRSASSIYNTIPGIASGLLSSNKNPILPYATIAYQELNENVEQFIKRKLKTKDVDIINREAKKYVYTHPSIIYSLLGSEDYEDARARLYSPEFLEIIREEQRTNTTNPFIKRLTFELANGETTLDLESPLNSDSIEKDLLVQGWYDLFNTNPELAKDIFRYTILFRMDEFNKPGLVKSIPFGALTGFGIDKILNEEFSINLDKLGYFDDFLTQFIQHNPKYSIYVDPTNDFFKKAGASVEISIPYETNKTDRKKFDVISNKFDKTYNDINEAPRFIYSYSKKQQSFALYEFTEDVRETGDTGRVVYRRIDLLGNNVQGSEYRFGVSNVETYFNSKEYKVTANPAKENKSVTGNLSTVASKVTVPVEEQKVETTDDLKGLNAIQKEYYEKLLVSDPNQLLDDIERNTTNSFYRFLAQTLNKVGILDSKTTIEPYTANNGSNGSYNANSKKIRINFNNIKTEEEIERVILHEMVHAFTVDKIENNTPEAKILKNIWNEYRRNILTGLKTKEQIRGISAPAFEAVLFKAITEQFKLKRSESTDDYNVNSYIKSLQESDQNLVIELLQRMQDIFTEEKEFFQKDIKNTKLISVSKGQFSKRTIDLATEIQKRLSPDYFITLKDKYYGFTSLKEFATAALTSLRTQEDLKNMNTINYESENSSLFKKLMDALSRMLSLVKRSLLSDAIESVIDLSATPLITPAREASEEKVEEEVKAEESNLKKGLAKVGKIERPKFSDDANIEDLDFKSTEINSFPVTLYQGTRGKRNIDDSARTAHPDVMGEWYSADKLIAKDYGEIIELIVPIGTLIERVRSTDTNKPVSEIREEETSLINESTSQVVILTTRDARGKLEEQYIVKDNSLIKPSIFSTFEEFKNTLNQKDCK